jgi:hypothetical protein
MPKTVENGGSKQNSARAWNEDRTHRCASDVVGLKQAAGFKGSLSSGSE